MRIFNLTQHPATSEQVSAGVVEPCPAVKREVKNLLTIYESEGNIPIGDEIRAIAAELATIALEDFNRHRESGQRYGLRISPRDVAIMIGGAPYLMAPLEGALRARGLTAVYAVSRRESIEAPDAEGRVTKVTTFRHLGFVEGIGGATYLLHATPSGVSRAARILSHFVDNCPSLE